MSKDKPSDPPQGENLPLNRIRVETALSRFPIHRLAKKGNIAIDVHRLTEQGDADFKWEVTYNVKHGQPGPLAYKLDTLIVNRRLDELGRPLPELVKLGTLSEICRDLGCRDTGPNIADIKQAFLQNASVFINAKIRYKTKTGKERWAEIGYSRYSVIFTGETLPDGHTADAVYIYLNRPYRDLLNQIEMRPLDYDYLMLLAPGPQRFYELLSFQVYGALAGDRPRARMLYSDYCKYAPQMRCPDFRHMKKQMYKIHLPHRKSGYISDVEYEEIKTESGLVDWEMLYTPGPKARAEFLAFTNRQIRQAAAELPAAEQPVLDLLAGLPPETPLLTELTHRGVSQKKARELLANLKPGQEVMDQVEYVDWLVAKDRHGKFDNPPGMYVLYIRDNIQPPENFVSSRKQRLQEAAHQTQNSDRARRAQLEIAYEEFQHEAVNRYIADLAPENLQKMVTAAKQQLRNTYGKMTESQLDALTTTWVRADLRNSGRVPLITFAEFCAQNSGK